MNRLGVLVDVAHCDRATVLDVVEVTTAPVVSSHTGARALQDFPRYLTDDELRAIAATGGLVGLWPYRNHRPGVRDIPELVAHARHIADTIGPEHLALGTDMNGVPGVMAGFGGETDLPKVTGALLDAGFDHGEVTGNPGRERPPRAEARGGARTQDPVLTHRSEDWRGRPHLDNLPVSTCCGRVLR